MTTNICGCSTETCGCCEGTQALTPAATANRPGLPALRYRVGTHGEFFETMKARLSNLTFEAPGADGQTPETFQALTGLTTRDPSDPSIALLDGWAAVGDVLTFYQERIANEGYLRTATERRSVLELARLVGYSLRPGVAATVYLAYTLDDKQIDPVEIPVGTRAQSIPGPGEMPQSFETAEAIVARPDWNNLQVRLSRPQAVALDQALVIDTLYVGGINSNLKRGDRLLMVYDDKGNPSVVRVVAQAEGQFADNRTAVRLQPPPVGTAAALPALTALITALEKLVEAKANAAGRALEDAQRILADTYLAQYHPPALWAVEILRRADVPTSREGGSPVFDALKAMDVQIKLALSSIDPTMGILVTDPDRFVGSLLKPPVVQPANSLQLARSLGHAFERRSDGNSQLLVTFAPELKETYYQAWENANVGTAAAALRTVNALRLAVPLFGANVPLLPAYDDNGKLKAQNLWTDWPGPAQDERTNVLFLDQAHEAITPGSYVVIHTETSPGIPARLVLQVTEVLTTVRTQYGISGKTTRLTLNGDWWAAANGTMATLRSTFVYAQSEPLSLVEEPINEDVSGQEIELAGLFKELTSGRWVILSGERADIPGVAGVRVSELLMLSGLRHDYDPNLPGDRTHTTLSLATSTAYVYKRGTLTVSANVAKATHGETRNETLGAGDGSQSLQAFTLRQPPLTFVPAPTPSGVASTLHVYVNDIEWRETDSLAGLGPKDRAFVTKTDDNAGTTVVFGNGEEGSRLPTGVENVKAVYRSGIGQGGNVRATQIGMLLSRPLGVKGVLNPLPATGGADAEDRDQARENAPLAVAALDRLIGLRDYSDFTRTFAGIAKADARRLSDGRRQLVYLTVAGANDIPIDPTSDLYRNLLDALRKYGDEGLPVRVERRELVVLALSARVRLQPDFLWEPVASAVRAALLDTFGFHRRALGQPALLCEVIGTIQNVAGVAYVDVDAFGGVPEKTAERDASGLLTGKRRLLTLDELSLTIQTIVDPTEYQGFALPGPARRVDVNVAGFAPDGLRPTQLAILTPAVPDTLILNQIL